MFRIILKSLREEKDLTQDDLGKILGKRQSAIGMWESGKSYPDYLTLLELARFFDVSLDYLAGKSNERKIKPSEEGVKKGTIQIAGRDGFFIKRELTDDQIDIVKRMVEQMPEYQTKVDRLSVVEPKKETAPSNDDAAFSVAARGSSVTNEEFDKLIHDEDTMKKPMKTE